MHARQSNKLHSPSTNFPLSASRRARTHLMLNEFFFLPDPHRRTYFSPQSWIFAVSIRPVMYIFPGNNRCPVCLRHSIELAALLHLDGKHALACKYEYDQIRSHNVIHNALHRISTTALLENPLASSSTSSPSTLALRVEV